MCVYIYIGWRMFDWPGLVFVMGPSFVDNCRGMNDRSIGDMMGCAYYMG